MLRGSCHFTSLSSCSRKPIKIEVTTKSVCEVTTKFDLPQEFGTPYVKFFSCKESPCTATERAVAEALSIPEGDDQFTKLVDPTNTSYYEIDIAGEACRRDVCYLSFSVSDLENCNVSQFLNIGATSAQPKSNTVFATIVATAIAMLIILLLIALLVVNYKFKKKFAICWKSNARRSIEDDFAAMKFRRLPRIFMVFSDDHPLHREVVLKFASVLEADFGFQVILDLYDRKNVHLDPVAWLEQSLQVDKVLVIWSPCVKAREQRKCNVYDMFLPVLKQVKHDIHFGEDASKYVFVKFEYVCENLPADLFSDRISCFDIPLRFENLIYTLSGDRECWKRENVLDKFASPRYLDDSDYGKAFKRTLAKMLSVATENPKWYHPLSESSSMQC